MPQTIRSVSRDRALRVIQAHRRVSHDLCLCGDHVDHDAHLAILLTDALVTDWDAIRCDAGVSR